MKISNILLVLLLVLTVFKIDLCEGQDYEVVEYTQYVTEMIYDSATVVVTEQQVVTEVISGSDSTDTSRSGLTDVSTTGVDEYTTESGMSSTDNEEACGEDSGNKETTKKTLGQGFGKAGRAHVKGQWKKCRGTRRAKSTIATAVTQKATIAVKVTTVPPVITAAPVTTVVPVVTTTPVATESTTTATTTTTTTTAAPPPAKCLGLGPILHILGKAAIKVNGTEIGWEPNCDDASTVSKSVTQPVAGNSAQAGGNGVSGGLRQVTDVPAGQGSNKVNENGSGKGKGAENSSAAPVTAENQQSLDETDALIGLAAAAAPTGLAGIALANAGGVPDKPFQQAPAGQDGEASPGADDQTQPAIPADLIEEIKQLDAAEHDTPENENLQPSDSFDGEPIKKCGSKPNPVVGVVRLWKKTETTTEKTTSGNQTSSIWDTFQKEKCNSDYHSNCQNSYKDCKTDKAKTLCLKTCGAQNCDKLKKLEKPEFNKKCVDYEEHNCTALAERGDCYAFAKFMSQFCPRTCNFCEEDKEYLPYLLEQQQMREWAKRYKNGKYVKYVRAMNVRTRIQKYRIKKKKCGKGRTTLNPNGVTPQPGDLSKAGASSAGKVEGAPEKGKGQEISTGAATSIAEAKAPGASAAGATSLSQTVDEEDNESDEMPADLANVDKEIEAANAGQPVIVEFDNVKLKKCGQDLHPIGKIKRFMDSKNITEEYEKNKCNIDYHGFCGNVWKSCKTVLSTKACPKTCGNTSCVSSFKSWGYSEKDRPKYNPVCKDNPLYNCTVFVDRGDALMLASSMAVLCPKTSNLCAETSEYLPYMPEELKIGRFLETYQNHKYSKHSKWIKIKKRIIRKKVLKKKCYNKMM